MIVLLVWLCLLTVFSAWSPSFSLYKAFENLLIFIYPSIDILSFASYHSPRLLSTLLSNMHSLIPLILPSMKTSPSLAFSSGKHDEGQSIRNTRGFLCMIMYHARHSHFRIISLFRVVILKAHLATHSYLKFIQSSPFQHAVSFRIPFLTCHLLPPSFRGWFPPPISSSLLANLVRFGPMEPSQSPLRLEII